MQDEENLLCLERGGGTAVNVIKAARRGGEQSLTSPPDPQLSRLTGERVLFDLISFFLLHIVQCSLARGVVSSPMLSLCLLLSHFLLLLSFVTLLKRKTVSVVARVVYFSCHPWLGVCIYVCICVFTSVFTMPLRPCALLV